MALSYESPRIKLHWILVAICVCYFGISFAQRNEIDSLLNIVATGKDDTIKVRALIDLSSEFMQINIDSTCYFSEKATELANKIGYKKGAADAEYYWGVCYWTKGIFDKAMEHYNQSLILYEELNDEKNIPYLYHTIGMIFQYQGKYETAMDYFFKALKKNDILNNKSGNAKILNSIGRIYEEQGNYDKALESFQKSLKYREETGDTFGLSVSYNAIGNVFNKKKNYDKALEFYKLSLMLAETIKYTQVIAAANGNIGSIYREQGKLKDALEYDLKCLDLHKALGDKKGIANSYIVIGENYFKQNKIKEAISHTETALFIANEIGTKYIIRLAYKNLSEFHAHAGNYQLAYDFHKKYSEVKDSLFNEESSKQITEMQTKYETEKKELQIENLNKDNAIKETEIKKQNIQKIAFASGFLLMLILAFVIFRGYNQKKKANEIITAQKTEVEKQKEMVVQKNNSLEVAYKHIEEKNTEILDSIRYAKRIQEAILPPQKLVQQYLEQSFILYKPKDIVAGDFYWMHCSTDLKSVPQQTILFASVDCTGHGVPGAFVSILGYNGLNRCVKEFGLTKPSEILDKLCKLVDEAFSKSETDIKDGMDIALVNLDLKGFENLSGLSTLQYAGAGNSLYLVQKINNETNNEQRTMNNYQLTEYSPDKQPIGKFAYRKPFTNHKIQLEKGDAIYIFTDGYADQFGGPKGKKFKYKQFEKLLVSIQEKSMEEQREILNKTIDSWKGELEQVDDICLIGVRV